MESGEDILSKTKKIEHNKWMGKERTILSDQKREMESQNYDETNFLVSKEMSEKEFNYLQQRLETF